jgi:hypothetical protein
LHENFGNPEHAGQQGNGNQHPQDTEDI